MKVANLYRLFGTAILLFLFAACANKNGETNGIANKLKASDLNGIDSLLGDNISRADTPSQASADSAMFATTEMTELVDNTVINCENHTLTYKNLELLLKLPNTRRVEFFKTLCHEFLGLDQSCYSSCGMGRVYAGLYQGEYYDTVTVWDKSRKVKLTTRYNDIYLKILEIISAEGELISEKNFNSIKQLYYRQGDLRCYFVTYQDERNDLYYRIEIYAANDKVGNNIL